MADLKQAAKSKTEPKAQKASPVVETMTLGSDVWALPFSLIAGFPIDTQADMIRNRRLPAIQRQRLLQRMAKIKGNRAVTQMLDCPETQVAQRFPSPRRTNVIQRALTEEEETFWKDREGQSIVLAIKRDVGAWQNFRQTPTSWGDRPDISSAAGGTAPSSLASLYTDAAPNVKQHIVEQLGPGSFRYLSEMASFIEGYRLICGVIPGVTYKPAGHKYEMTQKDSWTDKIPFYPVNTLQVKYSNAFGWSWTKELTGSTLKIAVEFSVSPERTEGGKVRPKMGGGSAISLWPARIGIDTKAKAESSAGYWGYEDLAGFIALVNGPSASARVSIYGGKISGSGGVIKLAGGGGSPPGGLDFTIDTVDVSAGEFKVSPEPSDSPIKREDGKTKHTFKDVEAKITLLEEAGGYVAGGESSVSTPELTPTAVPESKTFKYTITGYETESADTPVSEAECAQVISQFKKDIEGEVINFNSIREYIIEAGVEPKYSIDVTIEGYASRRWAGAMNDATRREKNMELSAKRAMDVQRVLEPLLTAENVTFTAVGKGSALYLPVGGGATRNPETGRMEEGLQGGIVIPEGDQEGIKKWREARRAQLRRLSEYNLLTPEQKLEVDASIEEQLNLEEKSLNKPTSDTPGARVVGVIVKWNGYKIEWGAQTPQPT
ncbi:MAG TPA: hypothetical protein VIO61_08275 [Anaerolineaceae bacterium]